MFSKDSKAGSNRSADRVPSIVSPSLRVTGDLVSDGDIQVDGFVEGDVSARTLTISEGATVKGAIIADKVMIRGTVHGQVTADAVDVGRTARVSGDIIHSELSIESGAIMDGHCRHTEKKAAPGKPATGQANAPAAPKAVADGPSKPGVVSSAAE